jgi:Mlc titration factor MtfA (ptsG expression regulator)
VTPARPPPPPPPREHPPATPEPHALPHHLHRPPGAVPAPPPLGSRAEIRRWAAVCSAAFARLRQAVDAGLPAALDPYGATNEAEFFAVATEAYFTKPGELRAAEPELYAVLAAFYRFEPRDRPAPADPFGLFGQLVLRGPLAYLA